MHGQNRVFGQPALDKAHPRRQCDHSPRFSVFLATSFGGGWKWQQFEWPDW